MKHVNPSTLSKPTGYTHVVEAPAGRTLYVSGQISLDSSGQLVGAGDITAQTRQVFENIKAALAASGAGLEHVVKITVFMRDVSELQAFRKVRDTYYPTNPPASSLVQVASLVRPEFLIEIEAVAVVPER